MNLRFGIKLHIRELEVIKGLAAYFNLLTPKASTNMKVSRPEAEQYKNIEVSSIYVIIAITKFQDVYNIIIPFF